MHKAGISFRISAIDVLNQRPVISGKEKTSSTIVHEVQMSCFEIILSSAQFIKMFL